METVPLVRTQFNDRNLNRLLTLHGVLWAPQHGLLHGRQQQLFKLRVGKVAKHRAALVQHVLLGPRLAHEHSLHVQVQHGTLVKTTMPVRFKLHPESWDVVHTLGMCPQPNFRCARIVEMYVL